MTFGLIHQNREDVGNLLLSISKLRCLAFLGRKFAQARTKERPKKGPHDSRALILFPDIVMSGYDG